MAEVKVEDDPKPAEVVEPPAVDPAPVADEKPPVDPTATGDPAKPAEEVPKPAVPPNPLDAIGPLPAEKLAASLEKPEFVAAMEAEGYTKEQLLQTARDAALSSQFIEVVGTPEAAKIASESAGHFYDIEEGFTAIQNIQDFDKFMSDIMLPLSFEYGADGLPVKLPNGQYKTDGTVERFFKQAENYSTQIKGGIIDKLLAANPDNEDLKDLQAAAKIMRSFEENGYQLGASPSGELTPQQKAKEAELHTREQALASQSAEGRKAAAEKFEAQVSEATDKELESLISATLNNTALSDKLKSKATEDIYVGLANALKSDRNFKFMAKQARAHGMREDTLKQIVAMNTSTLKAKFRDVASKVLAEYGAETISQNQKDRSKTDAQLAADRANPKGATTAGQPSRAGKLSTDQIRQQAETDVLAANHGQWPADGQLKLLQRIMELEGKQNPQQVA